MAKKLVTGDESRQAILRGVNALADMVVSTPGPKGRPVAIERPIGPPIITKDGVTVADNIQLADPIENMGAQLVCEAASKTVHTAGDGTTTAVLLARAIVREGARVIAAGASPVAIKTGIDAAIRVVITTLQKFRQLITGDMIARVGTVSANGDKQIGSLLAEAMQKVGKDGVITIEESRTMDTTRSR